MKARTSIVICQFDQHHCRRKNSYPYSWQTTRKKLPLLLAKGEVSVDWPSGSVLRDAARTSSASSFTNRPFYPRRNPTTIESFLTFPAARHSPGNPSKVRMRAPLFGNKKAFVFMASMTLSMNQELYKCAVYDYIY